SAHRRRSGCGALRVAPGASRVEARRLQRPCQASEPAEGSGAKGPAEELRRPAPSRKERGTPRQIRELVCGPWAGDEGLQAPCRDAERRLAPGMLGAQLRIARLVSFRPIIERERLLVGQLALTRVRIVAHLVLLELRPEGLARDAQLLSGPGLV